MGPGFRVSDDAKGSGYRSRGPGPRKFLTGPNALGYTTENFRRGAETRRPGFEEVRKMERETGVDQQGLPEVLRDVEVQTIPTDSVNSCLQGLRPMSISVDTWSTKLQTRKGLS